MVGHSLQGPPEGILLPGWFDGDGQIACGNGFGQISFLAQAVPHIGQGAGQTTDFVLGIGPVHLVGEVPFGHGIGHGHGLGQGTGDPPADQEGQADRKESEGGHEGHADGFDLVDGRGPGLLDFLAHFGSQVIHGLDRGEDFFLGDGGLEGPVQARDLDGGVGDKFHLAGRSLLFGDSGFPPQTEVDLFAGFGISNDGLLHDPIGAQVGLAVLAQPHQVAAAGPAQIVAVLGNRIQESGRHLQADNGLDLARFITVGGADEGRIVAAVGRVGGEVEDGGFSAGRHFLPETAQTLVVQRTMGQVLTHVRGTLVGEQDVSVLATDQENVLVTFQVEKLAEERPGVFIDLTVCIAGDVDGIVFLETTMVVVVFYLGEQLLYLARLGEEFDIRLGLVEGLFQGFLFPLMDNQEFFLAGCRQGGFGLGDQHFDSFFMGLAFQFTEFLVEHPEHAAGQDTQGNQGHEEVGYNELGTDFHW